MGILIKIVITIIILYIQIYGAIVLKNVWTKNLDIKKTLPNPFSWVSFKKDYLLPELTFSLQHIPSNYKAGIEVEGLLWENDFSQYFLKITNNKADILDLRIDIDFLGGIVSKEIRSQEGNAPINIHETGFFNTGIGNKDGQIYKTFESYTNNLKISCSKLFSSGAFEVKIIIKDITSADSGLFEVSYLYFDENGEQIKWANSYKILRHGNGSMYIDSEHPIKDAVWREIHMIPKKPLVFKKDGSINGGK